MKQYAYISTAYTSNNFNWKEEVISEDSRGPIKALILEGEFQRAEAENRNRRVYSEALLGRETNRLKQFIAERNGLPMSMDHPLPGDDEQAMTLIQRMGLAETAGLCISLEMANKIVYGKAKVLEGDHGHGDKLASLIRAGFKPGVSSRGMGGKPVYSNEGIIYVPEDYQMICYDWVSQPSTYNAILERKFNEEVSMLESEFKQSQSPKRGLWPVLTELGNKYKVVK